jgi:hypothetical protein
MTRRHPRVESRHQTFALTFHVTGAPGCCLTDLLPSADSHATPVVSFDIQSFAGGASACVNAR